MRSRWPDACPPGSVRHRLGSYQPVYEPLTVDDDSLVQAFANQAVIVVEPDTELHMPLVHGTPFDFGCDAHCCRSCGVMPDIDLNAKAALSC